jgi:hypothetical protein
MSYRSLSSSNTFLIRGHTYAAEPGRVLGHQCIFPRDSASICSAQPTASGDRPCCVGGVERSCGCSVFFIFVCIVGDDPSALRCNGRPNRRHCQARERRTGTAGVEKRGGEFMFVCVVERRGVALRVCFKYRHRHFAHRLFLLLIDAGCSSRRIRRTLSAYRGCSSVCCVCC